MSSHGRPASAPGTTTIVAQPAFARGNVAAAIIFGAIAAVIGLILTGVAAQGTGLLRFVGLGLLAIGFFVAVVPLVLRVEGVATRLTGWSHPTLEITPWPLPLGSPAVAIYRRTPVKANTVNVLAGAPDLEAELVCEEWVQYTVGTSTHTETDEVVRLRASTPGQIIGDGIEAVFQLTVPVDMGGPTLSLRNNRVTWTLETRLGEPFGARTVTKIDLAVPSIIDRDAVVGEGGPGVGGFDGDDLR